MDAATSTSALCRLCATEALASLNSSERGLSSAEAARRQAEFGPNEIEQAPRTPWSWRALRHVTHFLALVLWFAAALAFLAEHWDPGRGMAMIGFAVIGVIVVNGVFSFWQEFRAERTLAALQRLLPHQVRVMRDGRVRSLPVRDLVPGDLIYLAAGDDVPADCRLLEAYGVRVNAATLTGESLPQARSAEPCSVENVLAAHNVVLAGTTLVAGEAKAVVFATGMRTEFGRIAHLTQATPKAESPLQREIARLSRWIALLALVLGVLFFFIGDTVGLPFWDKFLFAIGIAVANVPEGLLPTVTLALAMGAQRMARRNALIRHLPSVETLGSTTVICTDKTGTLTLNRLRVRTLYYADTLADAQARLGEAGRPLLEAAAHCHSLGTGPASERGDPLEVALVDFARHHGVVERGERVHEVPFDSERRFMSTLYRYGEGLLLYSKGALETLLPRCTSVWRADGPEPLDQGYRAVLLDVQERLAREGLRVIALAFRPVEREWTQEALERELVLAGLAALEDPPRPEVPGAIAQCRSAGVKVIMVTGDHPRTALALARTIGLASDGEPRLLTGDALERLSDTQLQLALDAPEILFARIGAEQKRRIVAALKRKGEVVAVTGDGVNDAPALREAHIGIAMGVAGTDVAKESADMVLLDDNFASIVAAIEEGRAVFDNIRKFLTYILTSNIPEIVPYIAFALFPIPLPLTVAQILAVDLGTDMLPALALGAEPPAPEVLRRPPRRTDQRLVDAPLVARAYLFLGLFEAAAALGAFFFVLSQGGWTYGALLASSDPLYRAATGACLTAIVLMQVVNVWLCRSELDSVMARGVGSNRLILAGIGFELALVLAILYTPWGNTLFGTAPIPAQAWLFVLPFALVMLLAEEARKAIVRARARRSGEALHA
ncbi:cation-translocating P-type ATPase [Pelomicrobium sp.]|uniref:cation-translocating P-type ATPase n=1 Tax=Pelomicrobium sp. TaxID=2815319 RepID=UPI002FDEFDF4